MSLFVVELLPSGFKGWQIFVILHTKKEKS
jgi:hypothetical protein